MSRINTAPSEKPMTTLPLRELRPVERRSSLRFPAPPLQSPTLVLNSAFSLSSLKHCGRSVSDKEPAG
jgi:hypothetical protein